MDILFKKWSGPLLLPRGARWEETFCVLYRDRDMACAVQGQLMASLCWPYVSQHHALRQELKEGECDWRQVLEGSRGMWIIWISLHKDNDYVLCKSRTYYHFFSHFLSCPPTLWFFGWRNYLWVYPSRESLEKEVESCLLRVLALPPGMDSSVGGEELPLVFTWWSCQVQGRSLPTPNLSGSISYLRICMCLYILLTPPYFPAAGKEPQDFQSKIWVRPWAGLFGSLSWSI